MHPFFEIVEWRGLREGRVAALMGVSPTLFALVKIGQRTATPRFRRMAVHALALLEQVRTDGHAFTEADLFLPTAVPVGTDLVRVEGVA